MDLQSSTFNSAIEIPENLATNPKYRDKLRQDHLFLCNNGESTSFHSISRQQEKFSEVHLNSFSHLDSTVFKYSEIMVSSFAKLHANHGFIGLIND